MLLNNVKTTEKKLEKFNIFAAKIYSWVEAVMAIARFALHLPEPVEEEKKEIPEDPEKVKAKSQAASCLKGLKRSDLSMLVTLAKPPNSVV